VTPDFVAPPTLWRDCVGDEPEISTVQKTTATKTEIGPFAEGTLKLQVQPMRVDWRHEPTGIGSAPGLFPVLGPFPQAADSLLELGRRWAANNSFPDTPRVALGLVLVSLTTDRASGYRELADFVDGVPTNPDASDFMYQVNIPRDSHVDVAGLRVNRLSKWSVGLYRLLALTPAAASPDQIGPSLVHLHLELDINTAPGLQELLSRDKVPVIIDDLFDGAKEICDRGTR
jgi:hypothetical protein